MGGRSFEEIGRNTESTGHGFRAIPERWIEGLGSRGGLNILVLDPLTMGLGFGGGLNILDP